MADQPQPDGKRSGWELAHVVAMFTDAAARFLEVLEQWFLR